MLVWVESLVRREFQLAASVVSVQQLDFSMTKVVCCVPARPADDVSPGTIPFVTVSLSKVSLSSEAEESV